MARAALLTEASTPPCDRLKRCDKLANDVKRKLRFWARQA
jgi:hypothetical protein